MSAAPSAAYWEGAGRGVLVVQRCGRCSQLRHYPRLLCSSCWSFDIEPFEASPLGTVHSWTVTHHAFAADLPADPPYTLVTVDMADGFRVLGLWRTDAAPSCGLGVRLHFEPIADARPIPTFAPD